MSEPPTSQRPKQARSLKTEQALLDALETLLDRKSFADITVSELSREAGLTTGAIYRRFKDKEDVLRAAFQRFYESSKVRTLTNEDDYPESMTDREVLEKYLSDLMHFTLDHIDLMRAANQLNDQHSFQLMTQARTLSADWLASRLQSSHYPVDEVQTRARFVLRVVTATYRDTFIAGTAAVNQTANHGAGHQVELERLSKNLGDMAIGYLGLN